MVSARPLSPKGAIRQILAVQQPERRSGQGDRGLISQRKAFSTEPVFWTRVDPVKKEVFLGPVPILAVTL